MDPFAHLAALRRDGAAAVAAASDRTGDPVPGCPGWDVSDLAGHLGGVYHGVTQVVRDQLQGHPAGDDATARPPAAEHRGGWLAERHQAVLAALEGADLDAPVWTWMGLRPTRFWARRMALETAIHRWDLGSAHGDAEPIEALLAVDGVDEVFDLFLPARQTARPGREPWRFGGDGERLHLHATDAPGEWVLSFAGGGVEVSRAHVKAEAALRGPASELLLALYGRVEPGPELLLGDPAVLRLWTGTAHI